MASTDDRMSAFNQAVGEWLKEARLKSGMETFQAAAKIQTDSEQLEKIEAGQVSLSGAEFYSLISAYQIPIDSVNEFLKEFGLQTSI